MHAQQRNNLPKSAVGTDTANVKEPLLVDLKSAAILISSPVSTIRRLIKLGHLHYVPWGKKFLIDPQDIRNLITQNKIKGAA
jgi:hypothetical protein